jgi:hypothetical protein
MDALGRLLNAVTTATTAKARVALKDTSGVTILLIGATSGDATIYGYTAASGGTETAMAIVTKYWRQNAGVWTKVTQAAASTVTAGTGGLLAVEIDAVSLPDGYTHISASHATGSFVILPRDLFVQRAPDKLANATA